MNEADWLASGDPQAMLAVFAPRLGLHEAGDEAVPAMFPVTDRKLRLWVDAVACPECELSSRGMSAIEAAIYCAESSCGDRRAKAALLRDIVGNPWRPVTLPRAEPSFRQRIDYGPHAQGECPWLTPTVISLAHAAYDERRDDGTLDPLTLAALADALEEAGCDNEGLLRHLRGHDWRPSVRRVYGEEAATWSWERQPGPHVRGCWALDLVLGEG